MLKKRWVRLSLVLFLLVLAFIAANVIMEYRIDQRTRKNSRTYYLMGIEYAAKGNFRKAGEKFEKAKGMDKSDYLSRSALEVLVDFNRGIISKKYTACLFKGINYLEKEKYLQAIKEFQEAIKIAPGHYRGYNCLGNAYRSLGKSQDAIVCYEKAIQINPNYAKAYSNLGNVYLSLKQYPQALSCMKKAVLISPDDARNYYSLAVVYNALGKPTEAKESFSKAKELLKP